MKNPEKISSGKDEERNKIKLILDIVKDAEKKANPEGDAKQILKKFKKNAGKATREEAEQITKIISRLDNF
jgi:hypothetical protein